MRVITLNANGIRAAARKGLFSWLARTRADVVCFQELKAQHADLSDKAFNPRTWHHAYFCAEKKGYSGVSIWSRHKVKRWEYGFNCPEFDNEGRYIEAHFDNLSIVSLYAPSGSSSEERQAAKYRFMDAFFKHLRKRRKRRTIICGDWNIAHKEIDLKNWRGNQKNSGFLPEERAWMDSVFGELNYVDAFREVCRQSDQYTWWSNRGAAWEKNVGWRIDYQVASPALRGKALGARIYKAQRFSDHAPLIMDYDLAL